MHRGWTKKSFVILKQGRTKREKKKREIMTIMKEIVNRRRWGGGGGETGHWFMCDASAQNSKSRVRFYYSIAEKKTLQVKTNNSYYRRSLIDFCSLKKSICNNENDTDAEWWYWAREFKHLDFASRFAMEKCQWCRVWVPIKFSSVMNSSARKCQGMWDVMVNNWYYDKKHCNL